MKNSWLCGVSMVALGLSAGARASDLPMKYKAPVAQQVWNWTGFYVGAHLGVATPSSAIADDPVAPNSWIGPDFLKQISNDLIGGVQAGFNYQIANVVLGVEGDYSYDGQTNNLSGLGPNIQSTFSSRLSGLGTVRGRVGVAFDRFMVYGTGGVAFADIKDQLVAPSFFTATSGSMRTGWVAGAGVEAAVADHWIFRIEYLHVGGLPDQGPVASIGGFSSYAFDFKEKIDIARAGVSYKF